MRVTIRQKNLEITPALRIYIESKILKPLKRSLGSRFESELPILDLEVGRSTRHHRKGKVYRVSANLTLGKQMLRAEAEDVDIRTCCDLVEEELESEIRHFKERASSKDKRVARRLKKDLRFDPAARTYQKGRILNEGN